MNRKLLTLLSLTIITFGAVLTGCSGDSAEEPEESSYNEPVIETPPAETSVNTETGAEDFSKFGFSYDYDPSFEAELDPTSTDGFGMLQITNEQEGLDGELLQLTQIAWLKLPVELVDEEVLAEGLGGFYEGIEEGGMTVESTEAKKQDFNGGTLLYGTFDAEPSAGGIPIMKGVASVFDCPSNGKQFIFSIIYAYLTEPGTAPDLEAELMTELDKFECV